MKFTLELTEAEAKLVRAALMITARRAFLVEEDGHLVSRACFKAAVQLDAQIYPK